jgi:hypothetical protein
MMDGEIDRESVLVTAYIDAPRDGVDDLGDVFPGLLDGVAAEDHGVVVVAAELAEHEQGVAQVALAACPASRSEQRANCMHACIDQAH